MRARILTFGVGYDVNSRLLDKLARQLRPERIRAAGRGHRNHVSKLYNRIGSPVLTDVAVTFDLEGPKPEDGPAANRVYPAGKSICSPASSW